MAKCKCGCGQDVKNLYVSGHNLKGLKKTREQKLKIADAQRKAWKRSPNRLCFGRQPRKPVGSKWTDTHGYVLIKADDSSKHWKKEHVLIMEKLIGRKLKKNEAIHHINGVRSDNNPENLLLCESMSQHNKIEATWKSILRGLLDDGIVRFNRETLRYERA